MPGRKPKPTKVKQLEGNPGKRKADSNEPQPDTPEIKSPPDYLGEIAQQEWWDLGPILHRNGLLTELDYSEFAAYCKVHERWVRAERVITEKGEIIKTTNGNYIQSPFVNIAHRCLELKQKYLTDFGMNPSARSRVSINPKKPAGKFGEYNVVDGGKK